MLSFKLNTYSFSPFDQRTKTEMYRYLSLDIVVDSGRADESTPNQTVEKCLELFFRPEEREVKCEKCEAGKIATQTMRPLNRPKALLLHLKRFILVEKPRFPTDDDIENRSPNTSSVEITFRKNKVRVTLLADC